MTSLQRIRELLFEADDATPQALLFSLASSAGADMAPYIIELTKHGADVNLPNGDGDRALSIVLKRGVASDEKPALLPLVQALVGAGAWCDTKLDEKTRDSALHLACCGDVGHEDLVDALTQLMTPAELASTINARNRKGRAPLGVVVCTCGEGFQRSMPAAARLVRLLLKRGADPNVGADVEKPPLLVAIERGDCGDVVRALCTDRRVHVDEKWREPLLGDEVSALGVAVQLGRVDDVRLLIELGAARSLPVTVARRLVTPLELARSICDDAVVAALTEGCVMLVSLSGRSTMLENVPRSATVLDLKQRYQAALGVPADEQHLVHPMPSALRQAIDANDRDAVAAVARDLRPAELADSDTVSERDLYHGDVCVIISKRTSSRRTRASTLPRGI